MSISFWSNEPTILLNNEYIFELWPATNMCYEQKLNSISRLIILITILGYILTGAIRVIIVGSITLIIIYALYKMRKQKISNQHLNEGFTQQTYVNPETLESVLKTEFKEGTKKNPFSNVLLTQIEDDPERKSAPPAFNISADEDITKNIKRAVQMMNPGIKNTNKQLFGDLYQELELTNSSRQFFSTANTRVANDQGAFGQFLYGLMPSAKESTPEGNLQREKDAYRYTMY
jgi:hypothetical protein